LPDGGILRQRCLTACQGLRIAGCGLRIADCGLRIASKARLWGLPKVDCLTNPAVSRMGSRGSPPPVPSTMATRPDIIGEEAAKALATLHNDARAPTACGLRVRCLPHRSYWYPWWRFPNPLLQGIPPPPLILDPSSPPLPKPRIGPYRRPSPTPRSPRRSPTASSPRTSTGPGRTLAGTSVTTPFPTGRVYPRATKRRNFNFQYILHRLLDLI